jgi:Ca2+/Na+ antiporter
LACSASVLKVSFLLGARFLLDSGVEIARSLGVSEAVIALTLFAVGSSLPELITGITADPRVLQADIPLSVVTMGILFVPALFTRRIDRWQGLLTIIGYILCLLFIIGVR